MTKAIFPYMIALMGCAGVIAFLYPHETLATDSGFWSQVSSFIHVQQQHFYRELAGAIRARQSGGLNAMLGMSA